MSETALTQDLHHWLSYVLAYVQAYELGQRLSGGTDLPPPSPSGVSELKARKIGKAPVVILCSPHPDDEILTGALPLRLQRELGARVINLAVTLGSALSRQEQRWQELRDACDVVGFECRRMMMPEGFDLKTGQGSAWDAVVKDLVGILDELVPDVVVLPHGEDHHPAHVATHRLVSAALKSFTSGRGPVTAVETEYWRPMAAPNLLVGLNAHDLAQLLEALSCHRGEVERNPYHLTQPPRMMDTVRRGAELVKVKNMGRPGFLFGELYRVVRWRHGCGHALAFDQGWVGPDQDLAMIFTIEELWTSH